MASPKEDQPAGADTWAETWEDNEELEPRLYTILYTFRDAGPIFTNSDGKAVRFEDLEFDWWLSYTNVYIAPLPSVAEIERIEDVVIEARGQEVKKAVEEKEQLKMRVGQWLVRATESERAAASKKAQAKFKEVLAKVDAARERLEVARGPFWELRRAAVEDGAASEPDGQREGGQLHRSYSFLHERISWTDESRTRVERRQPGIERCWDDSKRRAEREAERKWEVEKEVQKASESVFTAMGRQRKIKAEQMIHRRYAQQEADRKAERAGGFVSKIGVAVKDASPEKIEEERLARMRKFDAMWSRNSFAWSGAAIKGSKGAVESGHPACQTAMAKLGAADGRHAMVVGWLRVGYGDIHGCMALPGAKRGHRHVISKCVE